MRDQFGKLVVLARGMPKPCECPFLDGCQKRFLWARKEVDLALHPVIALLPQVGVMVKFFQALGLDIKDSLTQRLIYNINKCNNAIIIVNIYLTRYLQPTLRHNALPKKKKKKSCKTYTYTTDKKAEQNKTNQNSSN